MQIRRRDDSLWVARAGFSVWIVLAAAIAVTGYVVVTEIRNADGFFVDQFFLPLICGLIVATAVAVATSGIVLRGRSLVAIDVVTINVVDVRQIAEVDDGAGLTIVTKAGRRIQPYVCGRTLAKQVNQNMRLRVGGDAIRHWQADHLEDDAALGTTSRGARWSALIGIPAFAALCGVLTVALHALS